MSERISKLILETEFKATGDLAPSIQKIDELKAATKAAEKQTLGLVEAEKKLEQAASLAGQEVSTQTKKQTEFNKTIQGASTALKEISQTNTLKKAFEGGGEIANVTKLLNEFKKSAQSAKSVEELEVAVKSLIEALPEDVAAGAIEIIGKEAEKAEQQLTKPTLRLRELKRLMLTETDPKLLKAYSEEAGRLQDEIGDTNDLIKSLSSDTFFTDTLVEGAQVAVGAFTAFQGALSLVTDDQEELAKAAQKAQGALALLQGTQAILNDLKKSDNIITRAQIASQKIYALVVGETTGAMKSLRLASAALLTGGLFLAVGLLAANWDKVKIALGGATREQRLNNEARKESIKNSSEEIAKIEVVRKAINDSNTSQEKRVELIQDLQKQYPEYLSNIDAETVSNNELNVALNKVNQALLIKYSIQAREAQLSPLFERKIQLEDELAVLQESEKQLRRNFEAQKNFNQLGKEGTQGAAATAFQALQMAQQDVIDAKAEALDVQTQIDSILNKIQSETLKLNSLQTGPLVIEKANKAAAEQKRILEGTIAFLEDKVSKLSKQLNEDLIIGSDQFTKTVGEFQKASIELAEARKLLEATEAPILFAEGSLNALNKQAQEIRAIIDTLPIGGELEKRAEELRAVQAKIDEINKIINGPEDATTKIDQVQGLNFDLLNEEERHQIAMAQIEQRGEETRLKLQLTYAKERLKLLQESGTATEAELESAKNAVEELEAELQNSQTKFQTQYVQQIVDGFKLIVEAAFNATQQLLSIKQDEIAGLTRLQEQRVSDAKNIADRGNAEVLQAEEERLANLQEKSREFARQQIALTQLQVTAQSALAIAKAAAQGGVAAPFTIAATLIALAAGYASARSQASAIGASFRKGGYTGAGDPSKVSHALGSKPYEYHKGEYVMNSEVVGIGNNLKWFEKIRANRLDLDKILGKSKPTVIVNNDNEKVVKAIQSIPQTSINIDRNGIYSMTERTRKIEAKRNSLRRRG